MGAELSETLKRDKRGVTFEMENENENVSDLEEWGDSQVEWKKVQL